MVGNLGHQIFKVFKNFRCLNIHGQSGVQIFRERTVNMVKFTVQ